MKITKELKVFNLVFILLVLFLLGVLSAYVTIYKASAEPVSNNDAIEIARDLEQLEQQIKTERIRSLINEQY